MSTHDEVNRAMQRLAGTPRDASESDPEPVPSPKPLACLPCALCGSDMRPVARDEADRTDRGAQPLNGVRFRGTPGYGSEFDTEGEIEIAMCDCCLTEVGRVGRVDQVTEVRSVRVQRRTWDPETAPGPDRPDDPGPTCRLT